MNVMSSKPNVNRVVKPPATELLSDEEEPPDPVRVLKSSLPQKAVRSTSNTRQAGVMTDRLNHAVARPRLRIPAIHKAPQSHLPTRLDQVEVVVLYTPVIASKGYISHELLADQETAAVAEIIASVLEGHVAGVQTIACKPSLTACLEKLDPSRHLIFNLCEGQLGRKGSEAQIARLISDHGFIHTGASYAAIARSANKWTTKKILQTAGLPTPDYQVVRSPSNLQLEISAPVMVKPIAEDGSIGITQHSLARTEEEILPLVQRLITKYHQAVLLEEYIAGREINVAMWGNGTPRLLPIAEIEFTWTDDPLEKFVTYASKWISDSPEFSGTPGICPARLSVMDKNSIQQTALASWRHLQLSGYTRIDMRLRDGIPYILEVNANPDLAPDAGFFRSAAAAGYSYEAMILHITHLALRTQQ